jgi:hypothetical protein
MLTRNALECGGLPPLFLLRACSQFRCEICGLQNGQQAGLAKAVASYRTPRRLRRRLGDVESQIFLRCFGAKRLNTRYKDSLTDSPASFQGLLLC